MPSPFLPRLDILPPAHRRLWDELTEVPPEFVLYGGTAIALHLGHRQSVDFDFFGIQPLDPTALTLAIPFLTGATVVQREPNTLSCVVDRDGLVKLSFFRLPGLPRLRPPLVAPDNGLQVVSLLDLAGTKVSVVQMRAEARRPSLLQLSLTLILVTIIAKSLAVWLTDCGWLADIINHFAAWTVGGMTALLLIQIGDIRDIFGYLSVGADIAMHVRANREKREP